MGLFNMFGSRGNAGRYSDSLLHIADSISNDGDPNLLLWRAGYSDFNTNSVLTVNPGEAAVFIKNGQIQQEFGPGRYQLKSENYPFLSALRNALTGGVTTFHCDIFFVRTALSMEIKWGTSSPIQVRDPVQRLQTSIRGNGGYKVVVGNPGLFITKLAGNVQGFATKDLVSYFASEFQQYIKSSIANAIMDSNREILDLSADLDGVAQKVTARLSPVLDSFGLTLQNFAIAELNIPEDDPNRQILEHAYAANREADVLGDRYRVVKGFEIMKDMANNTSEGGAGAMAGMGAGMGMGMAAGGAMAEMARGLYSSSGSASAGSGSASGQEDPTEKLAKLKKMLDAGLIDQSDYDSAKKEILAKLLG